MSCVIIVDVYAGNIVLIITENPCCLVTSLKQHNRPPALLPALPPAQKRLPANSATSLTTPIYTPTILILNKSIEAVDTIEPFNK